MPGFFRMRLLRTLRGWLPQYRENLSLAVPVMLSQVGQVVVQLFDNAMVGRLGALPLAAVSFGGAVFVIFLFWGTGLSMGLTPLVGEMYARRDYRSSARLLQNALTLYGGVGIVLFAILWVLGGISRLDGPVARSGRTGTPLLRLFGVVGRSVYALCRI